MIVVELAKFGRPSVFEDVESIYAFKNMI